MSTSIKAIIIIDGMELPFFNQLSIEQSINDHHNFNILLPQSALTNDINKVYDLIGKAIEINFEDIHNNKKTEHFKGIITQINNNQNSNNIEDIRLSGQGIVICLEGTNHLQSFTNKNLQQIVGAVTQPLKKYIDKLYINPDYSERLDFSVQYQESHFSYLNRLANTYHQWFYFDGSQLIFGKPKDEAIIELAHKKSLISYGFELKSFPLPHRCGHYNYQENDYKQSNLRKAKPANLDNLTNKTFEASASIYDVDGFVISPLKIVDKKSLEEQLKKRRQSITGNLVLFNGSSKNPFLKIGSKVKIILNEKLYGVFRIIRLSHFSQGNTNYKNHFEAIPINSDISPFNTNLNEPKAMPQIAVVKDNCDPENQGRVKVQFYWQKEGQLSSWIRFLSPYVGTEKGFYFLPDVGDEVMIGFEQGNVDIPFVIGGLYHGKANLNEWKNQNHHLKVIRTAGGNLIVFDPKSGEEKIIIKSNGSIEIIAEDIIMKGNTIEVNAKKSLTLKAGEIKLEIQGAFELLATSIKVKAQALMEMVAQLIKLN